MSRSKKPNKWATVNLPEEPIEVDEWFQAVLDAMRERATSTMRQLSAEYDMRERILDALDKTRKKQTAIIEALNRRILEELERSGSDVWRDEGHTYSPSSDVSAKVRDRAAFVQWVKDSGQEELLTVMPATVKSLTKNALDPEVAASLSPQERAKLKPGDAGSCAPPPGVEAFARKTLGRRKR